MKKRFKLILPLVILLLMIACKKEEPIIYSPNENSDEYKITGVPVILRSEGHMYCLDPISSKYVHCGYYNRYLYDNIFYFGCAWPPSSNCLPTVFISSIAYIDNGSSGPNNDDYIELEQDVVDDINETYGDALADAVGEGHEAVKDFYFNEGGQEMLNLPEDVEDDLDDDIITIKVFDGRYFIVNIDAEEYNDCPDYTWE